MGPVELGELHHVNLPTGEARLTPRSEVEDSFIEQLSLIVLEAEHGGATQIPTPTGLMLLQRLTPQRTSRHTAAWGIYTPDRTPLLTMGVAMRDGPGAELWRELHMPIPGETLGTEPDEPPAAPWLAAKPHLTIVAQPNSEELTQWLGDGERCIAWAWIEGVYQGNDAA